jgi:hypothetical protein
LPDVIETRPAADTLSSLLELVAALMCYSELPMDVHINCGMVLVLIVLLDSTGGEWSKVSFSSPFYLDTNYLHRAVFLKLIVTLVISKCPTFHRIHWLIIMSARQPWTYPEPDESILLRHIV